MFQLNKMYKYILSNNLHKLYDMVINIVLNNLLASLIYEFLRKYFSRLLEHDICLHI
jgi:hypothetical protein